MNILWREKRRKLKGLKQCSRERVKQASENRKEKWKTIHATKSWLADHWTSIQIGVRFTQIKHSNDLLFLPELMFLLDSMQKVCLLSLPLYVSFCIVFSSLSPHSACEVFDYLKRMFGNLIDCKRNYFRFPLGQPICISHEQNVCICWRLYVCRLYMKHRWNCVTLRSFDIFVNGTYSARSVHIPECNLQWLQPSQQQHFCTFEMFLFAM